MSLTIALIVFLVCAAVIAIVGTRMTSVADRLADRTGLGEAFVGAVFLGAATSLPGITASVTAAIGGDGQLALSNALGGIAAQTAFLAIADIAWRKANLEHAAASVANMLQASLLVIILALIIIGTLAPEIAVFNVHPLSPLIIIVYIYGMRIVRRAREEPMWTPKMTDQSEPDEPDEPKQSRASNVGHWMQFAISAILMIGAGVFVTRSTVVIADEVGINHTIAGALFTAVATSLPELVTSVAAVRRGALTLAVGGVIGGNCFDTLFASVADFAYREGSLYHAAYEQSSREVILSIVSVLMTAVLLMGMLRREKFGPAGIGVESISVLIIYASTLALLAIM